MRLVSSVYPAMLDRKESAAENHEGLFSVVMDAPPVNDARQIARAWARLSGGGSSAPTMPSSAPSDPSPTLVSSAMAQPLGLRQRGGQSQAPTAANPGRHAQAAPRNHIPVLSPH